ncbi:MAG: LPS export ABC transporter ATP-binding protein [Sedimenticola sp.]|uniref:Lipopolysaccharide export system ATP-binding protein LptB n=1 Tax=Sedimenticola thiotaurini TaxID=1543721 RepID=A0A558DC84_9GAMM|nr:LPS export ABC transporter ATP-binding protein [Sedimenticola sp.]MCW8974888.1 LPS export ABC transporter ATP-binding protein [Sedimenticola sp.]TVT58611.1 MAG: LPS export ABC transporter ATP-binding protein [Sedimenticola thiotaurini]
MTLLAADNLAKHYRRRAVVNGVSLELSSGEIVGLLGPNGAGKTTCFYMIAGLIPSEGGKITIDDHDITALPMHARARLGLGYLAQEPSIFRKLTVFNNIFAILETRKELKRPEQIAACEALLVDFNLTHLRNNQAMSLSGGERRRLEIARSLAMEPRFILLDEPFAGIDPISVKDIQNIIRSLSARGIGVLITDHNVRETLGICQRAYIISEGKVLAEGVPGDILANEEVRSVYLGKEFSL